LRSTILCLAAGLALASADAQTSVTFGVLGLFHAHELQLQPAGDQALSVETGAQTYILNGETRHRILLLRATGNHVLIGGTVVARVRVSSRDGSPARFELAVPERFHRIYNGVLVLTANRGELVASVTMEREDAVAAIVSSEMPRKAPLEALKAQAVVTRSFLAAGRRHRDFDFCDTTHCQFLRTPDDVGSEARQAAETTRGIVLIWDEHPIAALYSSRCGGQSSSMRESGMNPGMEYPYYSVPCAWCRAHPVRWQRLVQSTGKEPEPANESSRIEYARHWGWGALPGSRFTISHRGREWIEGQSIGHGIGLCQHGAIGMASGGSDFRSILAHYYPNAELRSPPLPHN
jgi:stage II sporulation protein D